MTTRWLVNIIFLYNANNLLVEELLENGNLASNKHKTSIIIIKSALSNEEIKYNYEV